MDWLAAYGIAASDCASDLGAAATLTVILRRLDTDERSHAFIAVDPVSPGDHQREAIMRTMADRFPHARWKTYNEHKQVASFVDSEYLYLVIYEEHPQANEAELSTAQQTLFAA